MTVPSSTLRLLGLSALLSCALAGVPLAQEAAAPDATEASQGADDEGAEAAEAADTAPVMGEWMTSSGIIEPSKYPADFPHYDYVNPDAPKGGTLNSIPTGETYDSFNPFIVRGTPAFGIATFVYDGLMTQSTDEPGVSHALIAEAMRFPSDYSSVTFRLDPEARWHDGEPITVEDVIWSFETLTEINPLYGNYYRNVVSAEETGEREVTFRFDQTNNRELPNIMGDLAILPKHWWEGTDAQGRQRDVTQPSLEPPLGSGPYLVGAFTPGSSLIYERVPDYWAAEKGSQKGRYNYDRIRYTYFRDQNAEWQAFTRGGYEDYRVEYRAQLWAQGYNFPAFQDGRVVRDEFPDGGVQPMQGWALNTRRPQLADPRVRQALTLAFNFQELDRNLFYGLYARIESYFQNSELAATGLPEGLELDILNEVRDEIPPEVFAEPFTLPDYNRPGAEREYLRQAFELLQEAGWRRQGSQLVNEAGEPFRVEFLARDQNATRTIEPYANSLRRLGIDATIRVVDLSQYVARVQNFDFDIVSAVLAQSLSPGNEQRDFWSSRAADQPGSRNVAGIRNPAVDKLIDKIIFAPDRETLVAATRALDRVLLWNFYVVPQWRNDKHWIAWWTKLEMPETQPEYAGYDPYSWWIRPDAAPDAAPEPEGLPEGASPPADDVEPGGLTPEAPGEGAGQ